MTIIHLGKPRDVAAWEVAVDDSEDDVSKGSSSEKWRAECKLWAVSCAASSLSELMNKMAAISEKRGSDASK